MSDVLTAEQIELLTCQIKGQIADIEDRLNTHRQEAVSTDTNELFDEVDRASVEEVRRLELNRIEHDKQNLLKFKQALRRLQNHDFGYCDDCGEEISFQRLKARPDSELCIDCQSTHEFNQLHVMKHAS